MVFIPTVGEYVTPLLVGGTAGTMYGNVIQDFFTKAANWPLGSALSVIMLVVTLALVAVGAADRQAAPAPRRSMRPTAAAALGPPRRVASAGVSWRGYYWLLLALLYLPIAILFVFSLNANTSLPFPLQGFTLEWYAQAVRHAGAARRRSGNSLLVAVGSSIVATVLGTMVGDPAEPLRVPRQGAC